MNTGTPTLPSPTGTSMPPPPDLQRRGRRVRQVLAFLIGVFVVLAVLLVFIGLIKGLQIHAMMSAPHTLPPTTVTSAVVKKENWAPTLSSVGSISPTRGTMISAEIAGTVSQVLFENGGTAKRDELLVKLDTSVEEANLQSAQANLDLAKSDFERAQGLAKATAISKSDLDAAAAKFKQNQAQVANLQAIIDRKNIRAPFDGTLGIREVNVGQFVNVGAPIVPLQSFDTVYADFAVPQQNLADLKPGLTVHVQSDVFPGKEFTGKLTAINPSVDVATRNVALQATFDNPDHLLKPGMFARIEVVLQEQHSVLILPQTAISYAPYGDSVYVIEKKTDPKTKKESLVLRQQFVRLGQTRGDFVAITEGLKAGEQVVSTGVFKLRNGIDVVINNALAPNPQLNPTPPNT